MSLLPLMITCADSDLSDEVLFRSVVVTGDDGNPAVAVTLTDGTGFSSLTCDDPPVSLSDILRSVVLSDGTVNLCY